jgi:PHD/YefM family antitoxin component YafN of YafNO toxin-antitoxin module
MKVFTYSEARKRLARVLDMARKEEVLIKRRGGETFSLTASPRSNLRSVCLG